MNKKLLLVTLSYMLAMCVAAQNIVKKCKECGKPIASCHYKGKHPKSVTEQNEASNGSAIHSVRNSPKRIDLGLPSGTIWADRNLGANSPEDDGYYYAWGETSPKADYSWATYFDAVDSKGSGFKTYFIYDRNFKKGKISVVGTERDAALKNWGNSWQMPTGPQIYELFDKCTWKWTRKKGKNGFLITGPNGNSIFLPASGFMHRRTLNEKGKSCNYWCGDLYLSKDRYEQMLELWRDSEKWYPTDYAAAIGATEGDNKYSMYSEIYRRRGHSIRPVAK